MERMLSDREGLDFLLSKPHCELITMCMAIEKRRFFTEKIQKEIFEDWTKVRLSCHLIGNGYIAYKKG